MTLKSMGDFSSDITQEDEDQHHDQSTTTTLVALMAWPPLPASPSG
jgi:hypothetical protein